jgi:hypothetical protein
MKIYRRHARSYVRVARHQGRECLVSGFFKTSMSSYGGLNLLCCYY